MLRAYGAHGPYVESANDALDPRETALGANETPEMGLRAHRPENPNREDDL
jgi:hypothetical protein